MSTSVSQKRDSSRARPLMNVPAMAWPVWTRLSHPARLSPKARGVDSADAARRRPTRSPQGSPQPKLLVKAMSSIAQGASDSQNPALPTIGPPGIAAVCQSPLSSSRPAVPMQGPLVGRALRSRPLSSVGQERAPAPSLSPAYQPPPRPRPAERRPAWRPTPPGRAAHRRWESRVQSPRVPLR